MRSIQRNLHKAAAILALIIGGMAIFAGGKVLLGNDPGYSVIDWLPIYNFGIGLSRFWSPRCCCGWATNTQYLSRSLRLRCIAW